MDTLYVPTENDFKRWIKEAVKELIEENQTKKNEPDRQEEALLNRKEIARFFRISFVTLNDWIKRGLPSHKQGGRIYFDKKEVLRYIKEKNIRQFKIGSKLHHLKQDVG